MLSFFPFNIFSSSNFWLADLDYEYLYFDLFKKWSINEHNTNRTYCRYTVPVFIYRYSRHSIMGYCDFYWYMYD